MESVISKALFAKYIMINFSKHNGSRYQQVCLVNINANFKLK